MQHKFVTAIPRELKEGVLYLSVEYKTATHLCACGCGSKVVTSITPKGWTICYDGDSISLNPSIGSWSLACRSHYWIKNSKVIWAGSFTEEQICAIKNKDTINKNNYYKNSEKYSIDHEKRVKFIKKGFFNKFFSWIFRKD